MNVAREVLGKQMVSTFGEVFMGRARQPLCSCSSWDFSESLKLLVIPLPPWKCFLVSRRFFGPDSGGFPVPHLPGFLDPLSRRADVHTVNVHLVCNYQRPHGVREGTSRGWRAEAPPPWHCIGEDSVIGLSPFFLWGPQILMSRWTSTTAESALPRRKPTWRSALWTQSSTSLSSTTSPPTSCPTSASSSWSSTSIAPPRTRWWAGWSWGRTVSPPAVPNTGERCARAPASPWPSGTVWASTNPLLLASSPGARLGRDVAGGNRTQRSGLKKPRFSCRRKFLTRQTPQRTPHMTTAAVQFLAMMIFLLCKALGNLFFFFQMGKKREGKTSTSLYITM